MAELSKTARASMGKQVKESHIETTEEAIRQIRQNRAGGLHIGDMSRVDKLLKAYDEMVAANDAAVKQVQSLVTRLEAKLELEKATPVIERLMENPEFVKAIDKVVDKAATELMSADALNNHGKVVMAEIEHGQEA